MLNSRTEKATAFSTTSKNVNAAFTLTGLQAARVYPVILDEEKGIILDDICQSTKHNYGKRKKN